MFDNLDRQVKKVVIDPGHGGTDSGAVGNGKLEKDYTLLISKYMYDRFKDLGIPVAITRENDITLSPTERVDKILGAFGNNDDVIVISNHINSGGGEGSEVIYALRNPDTLAKNILNNIGTTGQTTRKYYQRRLPSNPSKDYYFIHRNTGNTEPIIVEYGFIDSTKDTNFIDNNYQDLVEAVVSAVANYIGVPYTSPEGMVSNTYMVQRGDTLYSIARRLNTTVDELKRINNLDNDNLKVGQILQIPTEAVYEDEENIYTVKPGDTLYSIARDKGTTVDEIKALNNLNSNTLTIGKLLKLPSPTLPDDTYEVKRGDTLYSIAARYGLTTNELKEANNLDSNILSIGQLLKIPTKEDATSESTYIVKKGDSLYSIAREFNTTVDEIKKVNNLLSNLLSIGQELKLPTNQSLETTYTVQKGDSLYSIARKFDTTVDILKDLNNLASNLLKIGQILIVR